MPGKIPQEKIDQIREATDIVDIISQYVALKRKGKNYFACCPFHHEKTPSFSVNPEKQIFYCFGCHKGGNVYSFLMEHEKLNFVESVRTLADRAHIAVDMEQRDDSAYLEREALYFTNKFAARYFYDQLVKSDAGKIGLNYLIGRGLRPETIRKFGLGFAPEKWDGLLNAAARKKLQTAHLEKCGLVIPRKNKPGYYDRFRNRVIFPVFDKNSRVVAFGGRRMNDDPASPKYINSPETPIYQKRTVLYGLSQTRHQIQQADQAIMVEGYMDLISLFEFGIQNVVATSGTALTPEHAQLISRYTRNVVLLYDGDSAGSNAAFRGIDILLENDLDVTVVRLPEGHDPDSFVREKGVSTMRSLIKDAMPLVEFKARLIAEHEDISTPSGKANALHAIFESVLKIKDEIKHIPTIRDIAFRLGLDDLDLLREFEHVKKQGKKLSYDQRKSEASNATPPDMPASVSRPHRTRATQAEFALTGLLIHNARLRKFVFSNMKLAQITHPVLQQIMEMINVVYSAGQELDAGKLMGQFENPKVTAFIANALEENDNEKADHVMAIDCMTTIFLNEVDVDLQKLQIQIREKEKSQQDATEVKERWLELQRLRQDILQKNYFKNE